MKKKLIVFSIIIIFVVGCILTTLFLFPRGYIEEINIYAKKYNIDKSMIASIINIESGYDNMAKSKANARGLMQLMPSTAVDIAERLGLDITEEDLYNESINIELGSFYISYLLDMFDENITNALCAYNWGLNNVKNWMSIGNVDENGTISNIPVEETRNYLIKYKLSYFIYNNIYRYN